MKIIILLKKNHSCDKISVDDFDFNKVLSRKKYKAASWSAMPRPSHYGIENEDTEGNPLQCLNMFCNVLIMTSQGRSK